MADTLSVSALYHGPSDMVETVSALIDSAGDPVSPRYIKEVTVDLLGKTSSLISSGVLTRHYACKDLYFYVRFKAPPATRNIRAKVTITKTDDTEFTKVVPVTLAPIEKADTGAFGDNAGSFFDNV